MCDFNMSRAASVAEARAMLFRRKKRELFFDPAMLGEPAWDVLLLLYAFGSSDGTYVVDELIEIVSGPASTVRRWLSFLEKDGLVERKAPVDDATALIRLTESGIQMLDAYFASDP